MDINNDTIINRIAFSNPKLSYCFKFSAQPLTGRFIFCIKFHSTASKMVDWWLFLKPEIIQLSGCHAYLYDNCRLCSDHFEDSEFVDPKQKTRLKPTAVPTLFTVKNAPPQLASRRRCPTERVLCEDRMPPAVNCRSSHLSVNCADLQLHDTRSE